MSQLPILLTVNEVAEFFKISKSSVYRMVESGMLQHYKIRGAMRFDEKDLLHYLELVRHKPWDEKFMKK